VTATTCLVHDAGGRLVAVGPAVTPVTPPGGLGCQGEGALSAVTVRFEYDAWNRRAGRWDAASGWTEYVHDPGGRVLGELRYVATAPGRLEAKRDYVWLDGKPLAQLEYPGPAGRTEGYTYWYHLDHIGMPRGLTNESGEQWWAAPTARPYGDIEEYAGVDPLSGRTVVTNLRLPGQYDERIFAAAGISGLQGPYQNWNRWYLPTMGRYMELDPIAIHGGFNGPYGPNWYGYAEGNPLRRTDPTGRAVELYCEPIWGHGVYGLARHCYIRTYIPATPGYDVTVEIWGPDLNNGDNQVCGDNRGRPRELQNNPTRNNAFLVTRQDLGWSPDGSLEDCVLNAFRQSAGNLPNYNYRGPNSNTFAYEVLAACGLPVAFPWNAVGAP
jgi:RHS repeat-associated protein